MRSVRTIVSPVSRKDRTRLLPAFCLLLLLAGSGCTLSTPTPPEFESLSLGKDQWQYIGGDWEESGEGVMTPPRKAANEHLAFNTSRAYADFEAEFDFRWNIQNCGAGLMFRATDAQHYYMVHFPCTGQQYRAEHFWAAISKVDESGWVQFLQKELVHGVPSEIAIWHKVRLVVEGPEFRLWVDGRPLPVVRDDTYAGPGFVGLESYNARDPDTVGPYGDPVVNIGAGSSFRNVRIRGRKDGSVAWDPGPKPVRNYFYPLGDTPLGKWQYASSLGRAPNGDLLMKLAVAKEHLVPGAVQVLLRSTDNARSWSEPWELPEALKNGSFHTGSDGLLRLHWVQHEPPFRILTVASSDNGKTWSDIEERGRLKFAKGLEVGNAYVGKVVELKNGHLLRFGYAVGPNQSVHGAIREKGGVRYWGPITEADFGFSIRSTDGGKTWSEPVGVNGPNPSPQYFMVAKETGSEVSGAETRQGHIVALIRAYTSPWMWESWSTDGGKSWSPAARGPFPMYAATNSMTSTTSGYLVIAGRHPGVGLQVSRDDGMTWRTTRIDTPFYANGFSLEVEPDVVLYIYDGKYSDPRVRAQLIRVTPEKAEPVRVSEG